MMLRITLAAVKREKEATTVWIREASQGQQTNIAHTVPVYSKAQHQGQPSHTRHSYGDKVAKYILIFVVN